MWLCESGFLIGKSWQRMSRYGLRLQKRRSMWARRQTCWEREKDGPSKREGSSTNDVDARESSGVSERWPWIPTESCG